MLGSLAGRRGCDDGAVTQDISWLAMPDLVERTGLTVGRIRRLIEEHRLPATRRNGPLQVPELALVDDEPLPDLRGTMLVLLDLGFTEDEALDWLLAEEESMGIAPIEALRAGRKHEVRRVAQMLG